MDSSVDTAERTVGELRIRSAPLERDEAPYRSQPSSVRLERTGGGMASFGGPGVATYLIALVMAGLMSFALIVRSWPAIGAVTFIILALGVIVARRRPQPKTRWVEIGGGRLQAGGEGESVEVALDEVQEVAVGVDGPSRSLFVRVEGVGRVPLLYGLDEEEARAAQRSVRDALAEA